MIELARFAAVFGLGFFALVAQTLLFREFLTAFEGSELGVGSFFGSWLLWVAIGAALARWRTRLASWLAGRFELATLLYLPAFLLQRYLILHARQLGGVSAYELYAFDRMLQFSLLANSPISFVTGLLFTLACRWWSVERGLPVARVYVAETLGSFAGGVLVTLLLSFGVPAESLFLLSAAVLAAGAAAALLPAAVGPALAVPPAPGSGGSFGCEESAAWPTERQGSRLRPRLELLLAGALAVCCLSLVGSGFGRSWSWRTDRAVWARLLPAEQFEGSFTTAQAKYLYGRRAGQFVLQAWGGTVEVLPEVEHGGEVTAVCMSQHPEARRVLVVGPGSLPICSALRKLPQVQRVVWLHPDPEYPVRLRQVLAAELRGSLARIETPGSEVRRYLRAARNQFDLILLNLPEPTTLVLNRYWTVEFFRLVRGALADGGVVCVRSSGGANFMGGELVYLGAAGMHTLGSVFSHVALKPGDESWFLASDSERLSEAPAELRDRFAAVPGASALYPPDGLMSLYVPERIEFQMGKYRQAQQLVEPAVLLNSDRQPRALLFSLLLALRRTGWLSFAQQVPLLLSAGLLLACCPLLIFLLLRVLYLSSPRGRRAGSAERVRADVFDGYVLMGTTGMVGMSVSIVLMFLYQSRFGSLYLSISRIRSATIAGFSTARAFTSTTPAARY